MHGHTVQSQRPLDRVILSGLQVLNLGPGPGPRPAKSSEGRHDDAVHHLEPSCEPYPAGSAPALGASEAPRLGDCSGLLHGHTTPMRGVLALRSSG